MILKEFQWNGHRITVSKEGSGYQWSHFYPDPTWMPVTRKHAQLVDALNSFVANKWSTMKYYPESDGVDGMSTAQILRWAARNVEGTHGDPRLTAALYALADQQEVWILINMRMGLAVGAFTSGAKASQRKSDLMSEDSDSLLVQCLEVR